ncbi:MAG: hypothetical protein R3C28_10495 [Pirellulaceae bacterium]
MKQLFFVAILALLPLLALVGLIYLFIRGIFTVTSDWRLAQEVKQIRKESEQRRRQQNRDASA